MTAEQSRIKPKVTSGATVGEDQSFAVRTLQSWFLSRARPTDVATNMISLSPSSYPNISPHADLDIHKDEQLGTHTLIYLPKEPNCGDSLETFRLLRSASSRSRS